MTASIRTIRTARRVLPAALFVFASTTLFAAPDPPVLKMPGQTDKPIAPQSLLGKRSMDVRLEDGQGNVTIYHGEPLLEVLESNGLELKSMGAERKTAAAVVVIKSRDGYAAVFSIGELRASRENPKIFLVAETAEGPLPENEGPIRAVVYGDRARSIYGLATVELRYLAENPAQKKP